jgi:hypothetical protein
MRRLARLCAAFAVAAACTAHVASSDSITGRVLVNPLSVDVQAPDSVKTGREFALRAVVANAGSTALLDIDVRLLRDSGIALRDPARQSIDRIGPGRDRKVTWSGCARTAGAYIVLARASTGPFTVESPGVLIQAVGPNRAC